MTKQETFYLKPGENLYKFTDLEIQLICNALNWKSFDLSKYSESFNKRGEPEESKRLFAESNRLYDLQNSIENKEHSL
jgi:hypothetical protein